MKPRTDKRAPRVIKRSKPRARKPGVMAESFSDVPVQDFRREFADWQSKSEQAIEGRRK